MSADVATDNQFSQVPEWVIRAEISDGAFRLYALLLRYAHYQKKTAFPARKRLAEDLRKSDRSIDSYIKELVSIRALYVTRRYLDEKKKVQTSNLYTVVTADPQFVAPPSEAVFAGAGEVGFAPPSEADFALTIPTINDTQVNDTQVNNTAGVAARAARSSDDMFDEWWSMYPVKVGKATARKAYRKAELRHDDLTGKLQAYLQHRDRHENQGWLPNIPHPTTWLNQERWDDRPLPTTDRSKPTAEQRFRQTIAMGQQLMDTPAQGELE